MRWSIRVLLLAIVVFRAFGLDHDPVLLPGWRSDAPTDMPEVHAEAAAETLGNTTIAQATPGGDSSVSPPTGQVTFTGHPPDVVGVVYA